MERYVKFRETDTAHTNYVACSVYNNVQLITAANYEIQK